MVVGPDTVKNLESSVNTHCDALFVTVDKHFTNRDQMHAASTLSKSLNYVNDDQISFGNGPTDPLDLHREYGPTANEPARSLRDFRHCRSEVGFPYFATMDAVLRRTDGHHAARQ